MPALPPTVKARIYTVASGLYFRVFGDQGPGLVSLDDARKPSADAIAAEATARSNGDAANASAISSETTRATNAENTLAARPYPKYAKKLQTNASGVLTVTFPNGLFTAAPTVSLDIEAPANYVYSIAVEGSVTKDGFTAKAYRSGLGVMGIIGAITIFSTPGVVTVNVTAMDATA